MTRYNDAIWVIGHRIDDHPAEAAIESRAIARSPHVTIAGWLGSLVAKVISSCSGIAR
jgi:hypothetical protein